MPFTMRRLLSSKVVSLGKARNALLLALEGARHTSASANLAYLERDPVERPPRAQFTLEASETAAVHLAGALRDARGALSTVGVKEDVSRDEKGSLPNAAVSELQEVAELIREGERRLDEVFGEIRQARLGLRGVRE